MRPIVVTVGPLASAGATNIGLSQTPAAAGNLLLNGSLVVAGVAILDVARRVLFTTVSNESGKTITVYGTNASGNSISETLTGPNATTGYTVLDYKTVTRIAVSAAFTGAVTVGTNGIASSPWVRLDEWAFGPTKLQCVITGTVNYTVQESLDDPNKYDSPVAPSAMTWSSSGDTALVGASTTILSTMTAVPLWIRVLLNSGTGSVKMTVAQSANATAAN